MRIPILRGVPKFIGTVEVVRSFSYKLNMELVDAARRYESRDFFQSFKATCSSEDSEEMGEYLYQQCKRQVMHTVREFVAEARDKVTAATRAAEARRSGDKDAADKIERDATNGAAYDKWKTKETV